MISSLLVTGLVTVFLTSTIIFVVYKYAFKSSSYYDEIKNLINEMISQNTLLSENIDNLDTNVTNLREEVEFVKIKNEDLGSQIESIRDIIKDIQKT